MFPPRTAMVGRRCAVEPLELSRHSGKLYDSGLDKASASDWTYLPEGPFETLAEFATWLKDSNEDSGRVVHAIVDVKTGSAVGVASYLNIAPATGSIEVGYILYSPQLQNTAAATEAMYLMMRRVFSELGYRRYEWKCDALNARSRKAAQRLGFTFEGIFRQATIYKGRNRDTAWYSIIDREWGRLNHAFQSWLDDANFDSTGNQKRRLEEFIADCCTD